MPVVTDGSGHPLVITTRGHDRFPGHRRRSAVRLGRAVTVAFSFLYAMLVARLLLAFFHADTGGGLIALFTGVTDLLSAPFRHISYRRGIAGQFTLDVPTIVAIAAYALLHLAIARLVHLASERRRSR